MKKKVLRERRKELEEVIDIKPTKQIKKKKITKKKEV